VAPGRKAPAARSVRRSMKLFDAVAEMKRGKLARPVTWRGAGVWLEYRSEGQYRGFTYFGADGKWRQPIFSEELLGEWEICAWDRKTPIAKLPA
jgi:hypothetical protein